MKLRILLVASKVKSSELLIASLEGIDVDYYTTGREALQAVKIGKYDLVVTEIKLVGELRGDQFIDQLRKINFYVKVLVITNEFGLDTKWKSEAVHHLYNLGICDVHFKMGLWELVETIRQHVI